MNRPSHILIVDDHREIRDLLAKLLTKEGFRASTAADGSAMRKVLEDSSVDLIILDLMLPGEDGLALCRELRGEARTTPIIMLTAKGDEIDRVLGLEMGADDYVAKPFSSRELIARIKAVLRRAGGHMPSGNAEPTSFLFDDWRFHPKRRELESGDGVAIPLSTSEYNLLLSFVRHPQRVLSRDQLLDLTKGRNAGPFDRSVDIQVSRLRRKLRDNAKDPRIIKTVWGGGYIFTPSVTLE